MKRRKQVVLYLLMAVLFFGTYLWFGGRYLTKEGVLHACEAGLRYGPSEVVLGEYERQDGSIMMIGLVEDADGKNLSMVPVTRSMGFLWKMKSGSIPGWTQCHDTVTAIMIDPEGILLGLSQDPEITEVYCLIRDQNDVIVDEVTVQTDSYGFFMTEDVKSRTEDSYIGYADYVEGRNAAGEVLYRWGKDAQGNIFPD